MPATAPSCWAGVGERMAAPTVRDAVPWRRDDYAGAIRRVAGQGGLSLIRRCFLALRSLDPGRGTEAQISLVERPQPSLWVPGRPELFPKSRTQMNPRPLHPSGRDPLRCERAGDPGRNEPPFIP